MNPFPKMRGIATAPAPGSPFEAVVSWLGAFAGITALSLVHSLFDITGTDLVMLIGSFGASAVLVYGAISSPLAQPRNLVLGHVLSAVVGVTVVICFGAQPWYAPGLAVATAIALMTVTGTLHPPGGATALIAVIGSPSIHALGYWYVLVPVGLGALILLMVALLANNFWPSRRYPLYW